MKIKLAKESTMVSDTNHDNEPMEQPVVVEQYDDGISITGWDSDSVYMSHRMVKEVVSVMTEYAKPKKKKG